MNAIHHRVIDFDNLSFLKLNAQVPVGFWIFGNRQYTRRFFIQPVTNLGIDEYSRARPNKFIFS